MARIKELFAHSGVGNIYLGRKSGVLVIKQVDISKMYSASEHSLRCVKPTSNSIDIEWGSYPIVFANSSSTNRAIWNHKRERRERDAMKCA